MPVVFKKSHTVWPIETDVLKMARSAYRIELGTPRAFFTNKKLNKLIVSLLISINNYDTMSLIWAF